MDARPVFSRANGCGASSHRISRFLLILFICFSNAHSQKLYVEDPDVNVILGTIETATIIQNGQFKSPNIELTVAVQHADILNVVPTSIAIQQGDSDTYKNKYELTLTGVSPGHSEVTFESNTEVEVPTASLFLRVTVMRSKPIQVVSMIIGWMYFLAWSVSFYPQIYINWKRKSVVGLNFDFIALNLLGFLLYSMFNCGMYFFHAIQAEYIDRHPRAVNPVHLNDVFFSVHAAFATIITVIQCIRYEREDQRVSYVARGLLGIFIGVVVVSAIISSVHVVHWLDFLYYCSYIKLCITLIKYMPQAYMNFKRKSTVGWSIGNIILDFTGGFLSIFQMVLNAYNYNDWVSFFGDFTKFGLGFFSLSFDIFFMLQHYVFYRERKEFVRVNSSDEGSDMSGSDDGREYFIMVDDWGARYILLPGTSSSEEPQEEEETPAEPPPYQGAPA